MTWARLEDRFPWHRKVRGLSDAAFRLHVSGICWSTEHLTDGKVPTDDLPLVSDVKRPAKVVAELVDRALWDPIDEGWLIHDYLTYNLSAVQVKAERQAAAERQRRARDAARLKRESQGKSRRDSRVTDGEVTPDEAVPPSRPVPSLPITTKTSAATPRPDVEAVCSAMADVVERNTRQRPRVTQGWRDAARLLLDNDGRTLPEVLGVIDWTGRDDFEKANVLSVPKLRTRFGALFIKSQNRRGGTPRIENYPEADYYSEDWGDGGGAA